MGFVALDFLKEMLAENVTSIDLQPTLSYPHINSIDFVTYSLQNQILAGMYEPPIYNEYHIS